MQTLGNLLIIIPEIDVHTFGFIDVRDQSLHQQVSHFRLQLVRLPDNELNSSRCLLDLLLERCVKILIKVKVEIYLQYLGLSNFGYLRFLVFKSDCSGNDSFWKFWKK